MTVALALIEPPLALLAVLPAAGMWYVLHSHGAIGQQLRDLDAVHGFAGRVSTSLDPSEIADTAVVRDRRLLRAESVALVRFGDDGSATVHRSGPVPLRLPDRRDAAEWRGLLDTDEIQLLDSSALPQVDGAIPMPAKAIVVPVTTEVGAIALLVIVERENPAYHFDARDVMRARHLGEQLATSLSKGMLHERIEFEARHDALTGLPGRTLFESIAAEAVRAPQPGGVSCVLMLDLDRFKEVNDTLGHHAGDDLLVAVRTAHVDVAGEPGDVLARLAGDEFALLCHRRDNDAAVEFAAACRQGRQPAGDARRARDRRHRQRRRRRIDATSTSTRCSRCGGPTSPCTTPSGNAAVSSTTATRSIAAHPRALSMLGDLQGGDRADGLDVVYQPKLDLVTGRIDRRRGAGALGSSVARRRGARRVRARRRGHRSDQGADRSRALHRHRHVAAVRRPRTRPRSGGQPVDPRPVRLPVARAGSRLPRRQRRARRRS